MNCPEPALLENGAAGFRFEEGQTHEQNHDDGRPNSLSIQSGRLVVVGHDEPQKILGFGTGFSASHHLA